MSVSGNEEVGIKSLVLRLSSCDYPAGIPIKKRRYPMIRPPSPPQEEEPLPSPIDNSSIHKDQSSPSQGPTFSHSNIVTNTGLIDATKCTEVEESRESSCNVDKESTVLQIGSLQNMNSKEKAASPVNKIVPEKNRLNKAEEVEKPLGLEGGTQMSDVKGLAMTVVAKTSESEEKTEELLIAKENFLQVLSGSSESISLNLSLSKENIFGNQSRADFVGAPMAGSSRLCSDRANWDLNIPMDTWDGPSRDLNLGQTSSGRTHSVKPLMTSVSVSPDKGNVTEVKSRNNLAILSNLSGRQSEDSLHLRLSPCLQFKRTESSIPATKLSSPSAVPNDKPLEPSGNSKKVNIASVKAEPVEENIKLDTRGPESSNAIALLGSGMILKRELVDPSSVDPLNLRCLTQKSVKPEPVSESNKQTIDPKQGKPFHLNETTVQGTHKKYTDLILQQVACPVVSYSLRTEFEQSHASAGLLKTSEKSSPTGSSLSTEIELRSTAATCKIAENPRPTVRSSLSIKLATRDQDLSKINDQPSFSNRSCLETHAQATGKKQVPSNSGAILTCVDGKIIVSEAEDSSTTNSPEVHKSKWSNDSPVPSCGNVAGFEEITKNNVSVGIEGPDASENESDGNRDVDMSVDMEIDTEDDYEDGEVRESLERIAAEEFARAKAISKCGDDDDINTNSNDDDDLNTKTLEVVEAVNLSSSNVEVRDVQTYATETGKHIGETSYLNNGDEHGLREGSDRIPFVQEFLVENQLDGAFVNEADKVVLQSTLEQSGNRGVEEYQKRDSRQVANGGVEVRPTFSYGTGLAVNGDHLVAVKHEVVLPESITDVNNAAASHIDNASHGNRIINLPRSSSSGSPARTRIYTGRDLPARDGRERLSDQSLHGDRMHSRGREDMYFEGNPRYTRERHHDQTPRNSRFNFTRGRGMFYNRPNNFRGGGDREFSSEYYNCQTEYRGPRHKFSSPISDADLEYNSYNADEDSGFVSSGRGGGRKPMTDRGSFLRRMPPRRRSPPPGAHMIRRVSRNMSPNNRIPGEEDSELIRPRRNGRGFSDEEPVFSQPSYGSTDSGHFMQQQGNHRNFQRRIVHRIRSKSPVGSSRTRSPGIWSSSPRRRSPDGFSGISDQRSPPFYRMKSPDRRCFPGEAAAAVRRQDMREADSGREHNPSPSSRIVRRFSGGLVDQQERPEVEDFYGGEERRFGGERRGPVRQYRSPFNNGRGNGDSFRINNSEEGPSRPPLRFCQDENSEFQERNNDMAERDFSRRIKNNNNINRHVNHSPHRRMRSMEGQEVNYRHGSQAWHNDNNEFDEMSRGKRKRF